MIHQQAVDAAAGEVQAILQGQRPGQNRRPPAGDEFQAPMGGGAPAPPAGMGPGPRASPGMGPGASPGMRPGGYPSPAPSTPQNLPPITAQCWVNLQAPPEFNLPQRLRGPGVAMTKPCNGMSLEHALLCSCVKLDFMLDSIVPEARLQSEAVLAFHVCAGCILHLIVAPYFLTWSSSGYLLQPQEASRFGVASN